MSEILQLQRDPKTGHFLPGTAPGPGRPPEYLKRKAPRTFLGDMEEAWLKHGAKLIKRVIKEEPGTALRVFASLVPKELIVREMNRSKVIDIDAAELEVQRLLKERDERR